MDIELSADLEHNTTDRPAARRCIEFLGPPGSGKTFLLKRLLNRKRHGLEIVHFKDRLGELRLSGLAASVLPRLRRVLPLAAYRRRLRRAYKLTQRSLDVPAMLAFAQEHKALLEFLLVEIATRRVDPGAKVMILDWFLRLMKDYGLVESRAKEKEWLLFDESFAQKAVSLVLHLQFDADLVAEYTSHVPLPEAVLICDVQDDVLLRRLEKRGWPGWVDRETVDDLELIRRCRVGIEAAVEVYRQRGATIVRVDNSRDGAEVADTALDRLVASL